MQCLIKARSIDGTVYAMPRASRDGRVGWTADRSEAGQYSFSEAERIIEARRAANSVSDADSVIGRLELVPLDSAACKWHRLPKPHSGRYVGINESQRLYVIPCGDGFSTLGFDYAERRRRAVLEWLGKGASNAEPGTVAAYVAYLDAMRAGAEHAEKTRTRCPAELTPALVGLEGKRVLVTYPDGDESRFYVGRSTGWMPCHLEIKRRDSTGGAPVYFPDGARVRVLDGSR